MAKKITRIVLTGGPAAGKTTLISRIRKKIETGDRKYIKTVYGIGYQWVGGEAL